MIRSTPIASSSMLGNRGSFPMARLAEYLAELARLFGEDEHVHFDRLEPGSTVLVQHVDQDAVAAVQERLSIAGDVHAPEDIAKPYRAIDRRLAEDGATASLREANGTEILFFPWSRTDAASDVWPIPAGRGL